MSESLLTSSGDSLELSITENNNETFPSYSLLFDKAQHNFSTSSEISFIKHDLSPIDHNQTVIKETARTIDNVPTEESVNFNPFLLLFIPSDEEQSDQIETNIQKSIRTFSTIDSKESYDEEEGTRCADLQQGPSNMKTVVFHQERLSKR